MLLGLMPTSALAAGVEPRGQNDVCNYTADVTFESNDAEEHFAVTGDERLNSNHIALSQRWEDHGSKKFGIWIPKWEEVSKDDTATLTITADEGYVLESITLTKQPTLGTECAGCVAIAISVMTEGRLP